MAQFAIAEVHCPGQSSWHPVCFFIHAHTKTTNATDDERKYHWINKQIARRPFFANHFLYHFHAKQAAEKAAQHRFILIKMPPDVIGKPYLRQIFETSNQSAANESTEGSANENPCSVWRCNYIAFFLPEK